MYNIYKFQENQRTFLSSLHFHFTFTSLHFTSLHFHFHFHFTINFGESYTPYLRYRRLTFVESYSYLAIDD